MSWSSFSFRLSLNGQMLRVLLLSFLYLICLIFVLSFLFSVFFFFVASYHTACVPCFVFFFSLYFFQWSLLLSNIYIYIMKWSLCIKWWKKIGLHSNWAYIYIYILVARKIHHRATGWKKLILMGNFWTELMQCILATWLVYSSTWALVTINKLVLVVTKVV